MGDLFDTIERFTSALEHLGVTYAISGSVASSAAGHARSTRDIDLIAVMSKEDSSALADELGESFYLDRTAAERAIENNDCFNAIDLSTSYQVDVFVPPVSEWLQSQLSRRVRRKIGGSDGPEVYVCTPEDVILSKLIWFRLGNEASAQQMLDVAGILAVQRGKLDSNYLSDWAIKLRVKDLLSRATEAAL